MQAVVFVSRCRRQPDFRLDNRAGLWSECPPGSRTLPFLLWRNPVFFFPLPFHSVNESRVYQISVRLLLLRSLITFHCLQMFTVIISCSCDRGAKTKLLSAVVWWKNKEWLGCSRIKEVLPSWQEVFTTWWHSLFNLTSLCSPLCVGWVLWLPLAC